MTRSRELRLSLMLGATRSAIRIFGFAKTTRALTWVSARTQTDGSGDIGAVGKEIAAANGRPFAGTCLDRSVLLCFLARRGGETPEIRIGVAMDDGELEAHAWVVMDGVVMNDSPQAVARYVVFDRDPSELVFFS
ncbi:MAG: lasso peptide biosynthesis B2 protein [Acidimicrobiales bacterium]